MAVASFPPPCLYFKIVGILYHLVLLHFLDLFSSSIWFMWGFGDSENHAFTAAIFPECLPMLLFNTLKKEKRYISKEIVVTVSHAGEQKRRHVHQYWCFWMREEEKPPKFWLKVPSARSLLFIFHFIHF